MIKKIKELEKVSRLLDPPQNKKEEWTKQVTEHAGKFIIELQDAKAYIQNVDKGAGILQYDIDEEPSELSKLLKGFKAHIQNDGINAASGGHMGYIPGGGLYPSALGDYLAAVTNKYAGIFYPAPGAVRLENLLIRWMCKLMGFPKTATGNLSSGGSISNLIAVVTARESADIKARDFHRLVVYTSDEAHHSLLKALKIAGLGEVQLHLIPLDNALRMQTDHLDEAIQVDKKKELIPFFINGSLGTTNTGTIDPIETLADIAQKHKIWFHVDAAYGGFFKLIPEMASKFKGIERADSITLDPHKSLFLPFGTGAVLVRDSQVMHRAHQFTADYLQDLVDADDEVNPADVSPELTKHFRGIRMWLPMKLFGLKPFRAALSEKLLLANYFHEEIQKVPRFESGGVPDLSVALFRYVPTDISQEMDANAFNEKLIKAILDDGRIFLSSTTINGIFWIRVAVLIFRTHLHQVDLLLEIIQEKVAELN